MKYIDRPRNIPNRICHPIRLTPMEYVGRYFDKNDRSVVNIYDSNGYSLANSRWLLPEEQLRKFRRFQWSPKYHLKKLAEQTGVDKVEHTINNDALIYTRYYDKTNNKSFLSIRVSWSYESYSIENFGLDGWIEEDSLDAVNIRIKELLKY